MIHNCETASQITQLYLLSLGGAASLGKKEQEERKRELHKSHQFMNSGETEKGLQKPYVWEEQAWGWVGSQEAAQYGAPLHYLWPGTCAAQALSTCLQPMFSACDNPRFPIKAFSTSVSIFSTWVFLFSRTKDFVQQPQIPRQGFFHIGILFFFPQRQRFFSRQE